MVHKNVNSNRCDWKQHSSFLAHLPSLHSILHFYTLIKQENHRNTPKWNRASNQALFTKDSYKKGESWFQIILTDVISACTHTHTHSKRHTNTTQRGKPKLAVNKLAHLFSISGSWIKDLVAEEEQKTHLQRGKMENTGEREDEYLCVCMCV